MFLLQRIKVRSMKSKNMRKELLLIGNGAHSLAIQILGDQEDAADAVHDAFAAVLAKPESYDPDKS